MLDPAMKPEHLRNTVLPSTRFAFGAAIFLSMSIAYAGQHIWDLSKDRPWWKAGSTNCPGPHYSSIWYRENEIDSFRYCIDRDTIARLPHGGRARITSVHIYASGGTFYSTQWYEVDCIRGRWTSDSGYSVQNISSDSYHPVSRAPGWYEFVWQGRRPDTLRLGVIWHPVTNVSPKDKYFCPKM
jgi:hypothetical protein